MICDPQLRDEVTEAVSQSPGISVKKLVSLLNAQRGSLNLRKGPINRILYGNADRFRYEGHNPPRWYIRQRNEVPGETERRTDKSHQTPVPTKVDPPAGQQDYFIKTRRDSRRRPGISESVDIPLTAPVFGGVLSKELYSWQEKAIASWGKSGCRGVVEAVTGTGKTFVAISLINQYIQDRKRCLVVVPSQILMRPLSRRRRLRLSLSGVVEANRPYFLMDRPAPRHGKKDLATGLEGRHRRVFYSSVSCGLPV